MSTETATNTCDWCDRPATRGFGPPTGATHRICSVHDAAPDLLAALKRCVLKLEAQDIREGLPPSAELEHAQDIVALAEEEK